MTAGKLYRLVAADGEEVLSPRPGTLGGYRRRRIYGRLDCPSALRALAQGGYAAQRVFFANEETAIAAGYRPCGSCLRVEHARWRAERRAAAPAPGPGAAAGPEAQGLQASTTENG